MDLNERLTLAREEAGFANATEAAKALGVPYPTYAGHENGSSGFRAETGEKYARRFKVRFEWLMTGRGLMRDEADDAVVLFSQVLPQISGNRRERLVADLLDAARLEGVEGYAPETHGSGGKTGE